MGLPNAEFSYETMMLILIRGYFTASNDVKVGQPRCPEVPGYGVTSKTLPTPKAPPSFVVPYKFPAGSKTKPRTGSSRSYRRRQTGLSRSTDRWKVTVGIPRRSHCRQRTWGCRPQSLCRINSLLCQGSGSRRGKRRPSRCRKNAAPSRSIGRWREPTGTLCHSPHCCRHCNPARRPKTLCRINSLLHRKSGRRTRARLRHSRRKHAAPSRSTGRWRASTGRPCRSRHQRCQKRLCRTNFPFRRKSGRRGAPPRLCRCRSCRVLFRSTGRSHLATLRRLCRRRKYHRRRSCRTNSRLRRKSSPRRA
jgi:hypothetical protein